MIRRILLALLLFCLAAGQSFAQFTDQRVWGGTTGGTANAQTLTIGNYPTTPITGVPIRAIAGASNTTAATMTISGGTTKNVFKPSPAGPVALTGGEIVATQVFEFVYDGVQYVITSNINATAASIFTTPQGYLTPCKISSPVTGCTAGVLTPTADVTSATILYYEPTTGNQIPIYNGSQMVVFQFTEAQMTLTLGGSNLANTIYDVCVFNNSGTPQVGTTVAWTTSTTGAGVRGTGAGTAEITRVSGVWVNAVTATVKNGGSTYTVAANQCTIVASVIIDGTNGQVSFTRTYGQSRRWPVFNFYNRLPIYLKAGDGNVNWTYNSATIHPANSNTANSLIALTGLQEEILDLRISSSSSNPGSATARAGICFNVTNAYVGVIPRVNEAATAYEFQPLSGSYLVVPPLGINTATACESVTAGPNTYLGTEAFMILSAHWRG